MEKTKKNRRFLTMIEALSTEPIPEPEFGPSIVEPCHNLSIEEILSDYTRGIVHTSRDAFYDDGDDIPDDIDDIEDIVDLQVNRASTPDSGRSPEDGVTDSSDAGKPSDTNDKERSDEDRSKEGSGAEA